MNENPEVEQAGEQVQESEPQPNEELTALQCLAPFLAKVIWPISMSKQKRKLTLAQKAAKKERQRKYMWEYMKT